MGESIRFASNGDEAPGWLAVPEQAAAGGVVVIQEWWGLNDHVRQIADRFAAAGFAALAPDLYRGSVTRSPDEAGKLLMALDIERAHRDLQGAIDRVAREGGGRVGVVGFCMGGALSLFAACRAGDRIGACVVFYGGHPKVSYDFDTLRAPVLGHWAEDDDFANPNAERFEQELSQRGHPFEFHRYPGTRHAFFNDTRPEVYDAAASALSWERTLAFLLKQLSAP
jgi:carboxymethylenebutenolidase